MTIDAMIAEGCAVPSVEVVTNTDLAIHLSTVIGEVYEQQAEDGRIDARKGRAPQTNSRLYLAAYFEQVQQMPIDCYGNIIYESSRYEYDFVDADGHTITPED